jgi:hypothetical protein
MLVGAPVCVHAAEAGRLAWVLARESLREQAGDGLEQA